MLPIMNVAAKMVEGVMLEITLALAYQAFMAPFVNSNVTRDGMVKVVHKSAAVSTKMSAIMSVENAYV